MENGYGYGSSVPFDAPGFRVAFVRSSAFAYWAIRLEGRAREKGRKDEGLYG